MSESLMRGVIGAGCIAANQTSNLKTAGHRVAAFR